MKKKLIFIMLLLFPIFAHADEITKFSLNEVTASPGNNVTISVNIDNNQNFGILTLRIHYDNTKISYVSSELNGLDNGQIKGIDKNDEKGLVAIYGITLSKKKLMKDNGNLANIEFKIADDVTGNIPLTLEVVDFSLDESTNLKYETTDSLIKIKDNVETVTKEDKKTVINSLKEELKKKGIDESNITIESSDNNIATVDEDGNVEFKKDGNASIYAKDEEGNIVYSKDFLVKKNIKPSNKLIIPIVVVSVVLILIIILIILNRRKKCQKEK